MPELTGQGFDDLLSEVFKTGIPYKAEEIPGEHRRADGLMKTVYWNFTCSALRDGAGAVNGIVILANDVTDQVITRASLLEAEAAARYERSRLDEVFNRAPAAIAVTRGPDHRFVMANTTYKEAVSGQREILNLTVAEALPEVVEQGFVELLDTVFRSGEPFIGNETLVRLDRSGTGTVEDRYMNFVYQPLHEADGSIGGIFAHAVDVTDQVVARHESEILATQLEVTYESMPDGVLSINNGRIIKANTSIARILGFKDVGELLEKVERIQGKLNERYLDSNLPIPPHKTPVALALTGKDVQMELVITSPKSGQDVILRAAAAPIRDSSAKVTGAVAVVTDITERKILERQKDDFIGIATHELKTPVTSMKTYAQMLQRRFDKSGDPEAAQTMEKINAQINKLTSLIGDLLDATKIESGKLQFKAQPFALDTLVSEVVETMQPTSGRHRIVVKGSSDIEIVSDRDRVEQVLINLISNAVKYSPHSDKIEVSLCEEDGGIHVCVTDYGIGVPHERQNQVFERFFRVSGPNRESFPGLGLGLYISSEIVRRLGGKIWVESDGKTGSSFCFKLPQRFPGGTEAPFKAGQIHD